MTGSPRAAVAAFGLLGGLCIAIAAPAAADTVHIQVTTVRASDLGRCDERLNAIRTRLRRVAPGFRGFEMVDEISRTVALRTETAIVLPGGHSLRLLPKRLADDVYQMQVRLLDGRRRLVDTNLRIPNGGIMVFGVRPENPGGEEATLFVLKASDTAGATQ